MCQNVGDLSLQLEHARQEIFSHKEKETMLLEQKAAKEREVKALKVQSDNMRNELITAMEQQQLQLDNELKVKVNEIDGLKKELESKKNDSMKGNKRMVIIP